MRAILLILAAYAFVGWNDANAACQRFKPDGTVEACQHMAPKKVTPDTDRLKEERRYWRRQRELEFEACYNNCRKECAK